MKTIICGLVAAIAVMFWVLAWLTLDIAFVVIFLVILVVTWAIMRLLMRYARVLTLILLGVLGIGFVVSLTTVPAFREAVAKLIRETLQFEGAHLFVWAVLFTIIFAVGCLARPGSNSTQ